MGWGGGDWGGSGGGKWNGGRGRVMTLAREDNYSRDSLVFAHGVCCACVCGVCVCVCCVCINYPPPAILLGLQSRLSFFFTRSTTGLLHWRRPPWKSGPRSARTTWSDPSARPSLAHPCESATADSSSNRSGNYPDFICKATERLRIDELGHCVVLLTHFL